MALMFQRLARNFVRNGYFPTDEDTIERVLGMLQPTEGAVKILDPCCGEGTALAEVVHALQFGEMDVESFGVEYNADRAYHAKTLLDRCLHADLMDTVIQPRSFGLLWLNPPYGDLVSDQVSASVARWKGRKRLEKLFYERSESTLQFGGVMVLIIPGYALDPEFSAWIARHFRQVQVFRAATDRFQQVVVLGIRERSPGTGAKDVRNRLAAVGSGDSVPEVMPLAKEWTGPLYPVPTVRNPGRLKFMSVRLDGRQLEEELSQPGPSLWERFDLTFHAGARAHRRPLRALSRWHLALALSAGQISGAVRSRDGRTFLVRGDTHKEKEIKVEHQVNERTGDVSETRIHLDRFVPVIRAIDFTEGADTFGEIFTIR
jgi:hypothetical protein